jgi:hypothetical protein
MNPSDKNDLDPAEQEFEHGLLRLSPVQTSLDPQAIWALSLSRRESHRLWFWRATSAVLAASLLLVLWARRPSSAPPQTRLVYVHDQQPTSSEPSVAPTALVFSAQADRQNLWADSNNQNYLDVRQDVLRRGLRALTPIRLPVDSASSRPSTPPDSTSNFDRAIAPATAGPVRQFFDLLNKGSQL